MKSILICATVLLASSVLALPKPQPYAHSRIVGGQNVANESAPFIVSLQWATELRQSHFCAGAIIDHEWILTAAHCIQALPAESIIKIVAGRTNLHADEAESQQTRQVDTIIIHDEFRGGISAEDVALIRVTEAFEWTDSVLPIELPRTKELPSGQVKVYGWGSTSKDIMPEFPEQLQVATTDLLGFERCEEVLGGEGATPLKESNLCTGPLEGGVSACNGDSGGPLVKINAEGRPTLVGIVSWGFYPCGGPDLPSIYANVGSYLDWIEENKY